MCLIVGPCLTCVLEFVTTVFLFVNTTNIIFSAAHKHYSIIIVTIPKIYNPNIYGGDQIRRSTAVCILRTPLNKYTHIWFSVVFSI